MSFNPKMKTSKSFKRYEGLNVYQEKWVDLSISPNIVFRSKSSKSNWSMALGDLVKRTKRNLEGVDSAESSTSLMDDGKMQIKKDKIFQKTNAYKLLGMGRASSAFGSRNSMGVINSHSIQSQPISTTSKVQVASSFDDDSAIQQSFKK